MPLKFVKKYSRQDIRDNPDWLYVFGDNLVGKGFGGQAREARGELNTIGIPTKYAPGTLPQDYFSDTDNETDQECINHVIMGKFIHIAILLERGYTVVFPEDGVGTGLAELPKRAPKLFTAITKSTQHLKETYGE